MAGWDLAVLAGSLGWPHQEMCRWHGHWDQTVPTVTIVGFTAPQSPHLTENGADSVCVWDVFSGLLTDLCILGFSLPMKREFQNFLLRWVGPGYLRVIANPALQK